MAKVRIAFDPRGVILPIESLLPLKQLKPAHRNTNKYQQVLSSVQEVGIVEPLVVFPQKGKTGMYLILDGHFRFEVLKQLGHTQVRCLISTDDESYTYNKRVSRIATVQEHTMILKAIKSGISEERIAKVLSVDVASIRHKRDLLDGICKEAAEILKHKLISPNVFGLIKKMKPMRQIEVAELLSSASNFSVPYTKALLAATRPELLVDPDKQKHVDGLSPEQMARMEKEMEDLQRDLRVVEESHGNEVLNLVLARGYFLKLFGNVRIARYLNQRYPDIVPELQTILEGSSLES
jgi:hypothetical protein